MATGTITTITTRGFGFIKPDDGSGDVFFHASALRGLTIEDAAVGDRVTYTLDTEQSGRQRAVEVRYVGGEGRA